MLLAQALYHSGSWREVHTLDSVGPSGMAYGKTDDAMLHWWKDVCEAARVQTALEREIAWKYGLERLRC
jgi:hypothetical protein